ncbi:MAG: SIR2 family protein [Emergencia sp.]
MFYKEINNKAFGVFVSAVLRNVAAENGATLIIDASIDYNDKKSPYRFDAIAVKKCEDQKKMALFTYMFNLKQSRYDKFLSQVANVKKNLIDSNTTVLPIIVTNTNIATYCNLDCKMKLHEEVKIIDKETISRWIEEYPIDYLNAINVGQSYVGEFSESLTAKDFEEKRKNNINVLQNTVRAKDNFALVLGAGVSVEPEAKTWGELMNDMFNSVNSKKLLDNRDKICKKVGTTELISAQLCKDVYNDDKAFFWELHNSIYANKRPLNKNYSIDAIAELIGRFEQRRNFRVLTYNFDEYLETYLKSKGIAHNSLFDCDCEVNQFVSIYHVHGFLPETTAKSNLEKRCLDSIYLTEESYNKLYNHPYSWQIATQLSFFRENVCLFVGCGLTDPNIRRLLEIACNKSKPHYAILKKDSNSKKDLAVITKHFSRIGVEIIWIDDFNEIKRILDGLY